jgi:hypothetical protein
MNPFILLCIKIYSEWIRNLNVRAKAIKLFKRKLEIYLDLELGKAFSDTIPKAQVTKKKKKINWTSLK